MGRTWGKYFISSKKSKNLTHIVLFSFCELNTNVLVNSIMWQKKKERNFQYIAYVPEDFAPLFFAADEIVYIPDEVLAYTSYREVSDYLGPIGNSPTSKFLRLLHERWNSFVLKLCVKFELSGRLLKFILRFFRSYRQQKFLYSSGTLNWVIKDLKSRKLNQFDLIVAHNYLDYSRNDLRVQTTDLGVSYEYYFSEHYKAILNGIGYEISARGFLPEPSIEKSIVLRTRNYKLKAVNHNSEVDTTIKLVQDLTDSGIRTINLGSPVLSLPKSFTSKIPEGLYEEISDLRFLQELNFLNSPIVTRADAGLFVFIACIPISIVTLTPEWSSMFNIYLMHARAEANYPLDLEFSNTKSNQDIIKFLKSNFNQNLN